MQTRLMFLYCQVSALSYLKAIMRCFFIRYHMRLCLYTFVMFCSVYGYKKARIKIILGRNLSEDAYRTLVIFTNSISFCLFSL